MNTEHLLADFQPGGVIPFVSDNSSLLVQLSAARMFIAAHGGADDH
jgi:hypothetical protein